MNLKVILAAFVFSFFFQISVSNRYYCDRDLCPETTHIACEAFNNENCGNDLRVLVMNKRRKQLLLKIHNRSRNKIALGQVDGYLQAERMSVLRWDNELAYLAEMHAKRCSMLHDECRNTMKFRHAGQNIGLRITSPKFLIHARTIRHIVKKWFLEHKYANQDYIDSYGDHHESKTIGHFTTMISDRTTAIGCAVVLFTDPGGAGKVFLLTCNYSCTNFYEQPVYKNGTAASKCETGPSRYYPGLCTYREPILSEPDEVEPDIVFI